MGAVEDHERVPGNDLKPPRGNDVKPLPPKPKCDPDSPLPPSGGCIKG